MMNMKKIVIASDNKGKLREFNEILSHLEIIPQSEFQISSADETGLTFIENAILKARHACHHTKLPALADDSGLCVDYLKGAPGIYSARYSGEHATMEKNKQKILTEMQDVPNEKRQAYFICVIALMRHEFDPTPIICEGRLYGSITTKPIGENGFGYDPILWVPEYNCTVAELKSEVKNQISHRGKALAKLANIL